MAVVQYVDVVANVRITRGMPVPKKVTSLDHWLKDARKVISQIPSSTQCIVEQASSSPTNIIFNLRRPDGSRVYVAIDRTRDGMVLR